jgi:hypothetical protein
MVLSNLQDTEIGLALARQALDLFRTSSPGTGARRTRAQGMSHHETVDVDGGLE